MKKSILVFIFTLSLSAAALAQNQTYSDTFTVTTYYPAPHGVYGTMRLYPGREPTEGVEPGAMYYDQAQNVIKFRNDTAWVNLSGGGGSASGSVRVGNQTTVLNSNCNVSFEGGLRYNSITKQLEACDGKTWKISVPPPGGVTYTRVTIKNGSGRVGTPFSANAIVTGCSGSATVSCNYRSDWMHCSQGGQSSSGVAAKSVANFPCSGSVSGNTVTASFDATSACKSFNYDCGGAWVCCNTWTFWSTGSSPSDSTATVEIQDKTVGEIDAR